MKAKGLIVEIKENGEVIGRLTAKQFMQYMDRPNKFLADLVKDFNAQDRGTTAEVRIDA